VSSAGSHTGTGQGDPAGSPPHSRATVPLPLERADELGEIDRALADARVSRGRIVVLEAAAGLGKTLLLAHAAERAEAIDMLVLRASGGELERSYPLGLALQLFEPYLRTATRRERERVLAGAAAHAESLLTGRAAPPGASSAPEPPLLHGLHWVAANIAERQPLLLAIDDAHTGDEASLRALLYTAERIEDLPLAVVLAARPRPASAGGGDALTALSTHPATRRLDLAPLSEEAIATIVRARLPEADDAFCAACARATGGNPFFTRELLVALASADLAPDAMDAEAVEEVGPATIARAVAVRLERCSPSAAPLAQALAVAGDGVELAHAAALAGVDEATAAQAVGELADVDILQSASASAFVHPIVRQSVYLGIPAPRRERMHLDTARLLLTAPAGGEERAAAHLLHTTPAHEEWIVSTLAVAAERALAGGSPETAVQYLLRALDESPPAGRRAALLIDLGRAEALAGHPTASDRLRAAIKLLDEPRERAQALAQLGRALYIAGDNPAAASAFDEGLRILGGADRVLHEELTAGYLGAARLDFRTREAALERFKDLLAGSSDAETPVQRELLAQRALEHAMQGSASHEEVVTLIRRAQDGDRLLREVTADGVAYAGAAAALLFVDALDDAEATATAGLEDARRRSSVIGFAIMSSVRGAARYLRGDIVGGLGDLQGGLERVQLMVLVRPFANGWMALAHIDRGELEQADRLVGRPDEEQDRHFTYNWSLFARARLALACGDAARALQDLEECGRRQAAVPAPSPAVLPWRSEAALAARALDRTREARTLAAEELRLARAVGSPRALGNAQRVAGIVTGGKAGLELLEQAVSTLERSPSRLERVRALVDLGAAQRVAGEVQRARTTLREGLDVAHHCGASGLASLARTELIAAGARPRRPAMRGADALTPSERRVTELAEQGLTNRDIAQALFVSTKTVEFHLRNAYAKLRIGSRRELSVALRGGLDAAGGDSGAPVDGDRSAAHGGAVV
jgi:DNA-binding CsgD family transcriptional regulator